MRYDQGLSLCHCKLPSKNESRVSARPRTRATLGGGFLTRMDPKTSKVTSQSISWHISTISATFFAVDFYSPRPAPSKPTFRGRRRFLIVLEGPLPTYDLLVDRFIPRLGFPMDSFILYDFFESRRAIPRKQLYDTLVTRYSTLNKV